MSATTRYLVLSELVRLCGPQQYIYIYMIIRTIYILFSYTFLMNLRSTAHDIVCGVDLRTLSAASRLGKQECYGPRHNSGVRQNSEQKHLH